jgi:AcrR family transcriptional regulator
MTRAYLTSAERRARILDAAAGVFVARGFHAASVDEVAAAAQLSVGGLYRHFPGKAALVLALVAADADLAARRVEQAATAAADHGENATGVLLAGVAALFTRLAEPGSAVLHVEILAAAARDPEVAAAAAAHDAALSDHVRRALAAAAAPGSPAAVDPDAAVELLAVLVDGIAGRCAVLGSFHPGWHDLAAATARSLVEGPAA